MPHAGPAARTSFEASLEQELFSKFVSLHLLAAMASFTGIGVSSLPDERIFLMLITSVCALPPVLALLVPDWVRRHVIPLWSLVSGGVLMVVVSVGHDVALTSAALLYGALGPLPPRWRGVPFLMTAVGWAATRGMTPDPVSMFLLLWCGIFMVWLSSAAFQSRRASWLELRLSLHQDRLLTQDLDAVTPSSNAYLDEPDLITEAVRELESALRTAEGEQREGIQRALTSLRRAVADTGANVSLGFSTRFRLAEVLDDAWRAAMAETRSPIRARLELSADLEAYGDVPRVTSMFREILMEFSMSAAGEVPRSVTVEACTNNSDLTVTLTASDDRPLAGSVLHHLEVRADEAGCHLQLQAGVLRVELPGTAVA